MAKWFIVYNDYSEAVRAVFAAVSEFTVVSCIEADKLSDDARKNDNLIYVGLNMLELPDNGYHIKAFNNEFGHDTIILDGSDRINLMYAAMDFKNKYLVKAINADVHCPTYYFNKPFSDKMPEYDESFTPYIKNRALWSWGYVIYDYKGYIDNMLKLKLNMLIIWNDFPPLNARELVEYAHSRGVKIIWGFSCGWSTNCNAADLDSLDEISNSVVQNYEQNYAQLGGDGIYFQTFTETAAETIGGRVIADTAVELINKTSARLLELHPELEIQFGLHATSVKNRLEYIRKVDSRVTILWEDCGAFPYAYIPKRTENFAETLEFTERIRTLRSSGFGALFKGMTALDWSTFKHQPGPYVIGEYEKSFIAAKTEEKHRIWKYIQAYWLSNAGFVRETVKRLDSDTLVAALVEDGLFESGLWYPVALYSEILWNPNRNMDEILTDTALIPDVDFA